MSSVEWLSAVMQDEGLTSTEKSVAAALFSYMSKDGRCWPSLAALAERASLKKSDTARRAVVSLIQRGWLTRTVQPNGRHSSNLYRIRHPVKRGAVVDLAPRLTGGGDPVKRGALGTPSNGVLTKTIELRAVTPLDDFLADPNVMPRP